MPVSLSRPAVWTCCFAFLLSGFAALVYQISWTRQIGLLFGHTVHASAIVLGGFFLGMAAGYGLGERLARRMPPLIGYVGAELIAAGWAIAIPVILGRFQTAESILWLSSSSAATQVAQRGLFCTLLLLPATIALGATLPLMAEFLASDRELAIQRIATAYSWNTAGALLGVASAAMFLLVYFGVRGSSYFAAGLSSLAGLMIWLLAWRIGRHEGGLVSSNSATPDSEGHDLLDRGPATRHWIILALAGACGFAILVLEVLYTRLFSLVFHNSAHTFGAVVAVFLGGLSAGAALASKLPRRLRPESLLPWISFAGSLAIGLSTAVFVAGTGLEYFTFGESFAAYLAGGSLLAAAVIFPPVLLLGMLLPLLWRCSEEISKDALGIGSLTMVNTLGAGLGSLAASFLLLPLVGLWGAFAAVAGLFGLMGSGLFLHQRRTALSLLSLTLSGTVAASLAFATVFWNRPASSADERIVRRWESAYGWIDVVQQKDTGEWKIRQNLHYRMGATGASAVREHRQAHIPLLLHAHPREVVILGQGTGVTASAALLHPEVERVTIVELIPEVVEAARSLSAFNRGVLDDPKVTVEIDDARHFLLRSTKRCDVIVADLFVPWESHTGYLYTQEHYQIAKGRLRPQGLFCQWLPLYQLGESEFEAIANTFRSVFPEVTLWWGQLDPNRAIIAMIGSDGSRAWDLDAIDRRILALSGEFRDPMLESADRVLGLSAGTWRRTFDQPLNTDEHPYVEFCSPGSHGDRRLLKGQTLRLMYDRLLKELPERGGVPSDDVDTRRAWHRFLLFGS